MAGVRLGFERSLFLLGIGSIVSIGSIAALEACGPQVEDSAVSALGGAANEARAIAPEGTQLFMPPRAITLSIPWEHSIASGGIDSFVHRTVNGVTTFAGPGQPPLPIFLNRFGGTYSPGQDDSRRNTSIVPNQVSTVSAFSGSDSQWNQAVNCITTMWAPYNVTITQTEPASGEYIEAVIGGSPGQVGLPQGVGGVAPIDQFQCSIIPNAIIYAFADVVGNDPEEVCEIAAQEIAHAFSLDHEYYCPDPMTYLGGCGNKTFRDFDAQCGEYQPRGCNCSRPSQNSVQTLLDKIGAPNGMPPPPVNDPIPPTISINSPADGATLMENSTITVVATASDDMQLSATELVWNFNGQTFPCPYTNSGGAVTCTRSGNISTWSIRVGQGDRTFTARARDAGNNVTTTPPRTIHLGTATPPPMDTVPPTASITSPAPNASLPANSTIQITATANDNIGLASVELVWAFGNDSFPCPFSGQGVACTQSGTTYTWSLSVGVGTRQFSVRAVDLAGNRFETPQQMVSLTTQPMMPPNMGDIVAEPNNTPTDAFPLRCANAIDLVVSSANEDWFSVDAPANTDVQVNFSAAAGTVIGAELYTAGATMQLAQTADVLGNGGSIRAISQGPVILVHVTTGGGEVGYRLTTLCNNGGMPPPMNNDDTFEPNNDAATASHVMCGQMIGNLIANDPDFFAVNVPAGNALHAVATGTGIQISIQDTAGHEIAPPGSEARTTSLPGGDVIVKVAPTTNGAQYGLNLDCAPPSGGNHTDDPLPARQALAGGCSCSTSDAETGGAAGAAILWALLGIAVALRSARARRGL